MISRVSIANYKSIREIDFAARRVNVFIGEPNSGKSNLLEAIGLMSPPALESLLPAFRIEQVADLFADQDVTRDITVKLDPAAQLCLRWSEGEFAAEYRNAGASGPPGITYSMS